MKLRKLLLPGLLAAVMVGFIGCSGHSVNPAPIEKSFESADPVTKSAADNIVASIKSGNYSGALVDLQKLVNDARLTPNQQKAVKDVLAQVQKAIAAGASKAADQVDKAAKDLQKSLPQ